MALAAWGGHVMRMRMRMRTADVACVCVCVSEGGGERGVPCHRETGRIKLLALRFVSGSGGKRLERKEGSGKVRSFLLVCQPD